MQLLISEGQNSIVDAYISLLVFVGVLFSSLGYPIAEILTGLAIGGTLSRLEFGLGKLLKRRFLKS